MLVPRLSEEAAWKPPPGQRGRVCLWRCSSRGGVGVQRAGLLCHLGHLESKYVWCKWAEPMSPHPRLSPPSQAGPGPLGVSDLLCAWSVPQGEREPGRWQ